MGHAWKHQTLHFDMSNIDLASFAVNEGKSGFHRITGHANFSRPDIGSATGNHANGA